MSRKRLSLGVSAYALDKVAVALVQLLTVPVLANAWGLELFGIWAMAITIPAFLVLGDFGIVNSAWARMTQFIARDDWKAARATLHTAWLVTIGLVAVAALITASIVYFLPNGVVPTLKNFGERDARELLFVLLVYGLSTIVFRLNTAAYRAAMKYSLSVLCGTSAYFLENIAVVILALLGHGPVAAAIALLVLRLVSIVVLFILSFRVVPNLKPGFKFASMAEWKELWRPALAASALGFGLAAYLQGSVVILGALAGSAVVPAFVAVRTISRLGVQMATLISIPVSQEFGNAMGRGEMHRGGRFFGLILATSSAMALALGAGLALFGERIVALWTHGAITADPKLLVLMAISSVAAMMWNPLSNLILALNRQHSFSYANLAISGVGLLMIYFLAGRMGSPAAGLSFALVDCVTLGAVIIFIHRNWLQSEAFRAGLISGVAELCSPVALVRSVLKSR